VPLAEEVDADEHVELALAQSAQDLDALKGVNLAVEVADVDADVAEVIGEFLSGALGQRGDEDALFPLDALAGFFDEVVMQWPRVSARIEAMEPIAQAAS